ncbi:hypothetical protein KDW37_28890 [Burkholderia cenocepacia]|uniref:hypothetical protein n=1 Tax=Burkholderia cenocepacia TaxID=95486 RepID=UPI001B9C3869|nr:hypothetical protein [Burkholderia cenocepacia]MBR8434785.1 hypothetical protein [Burkholderia cenocepacia]
MNFNISDEDLDAIDTIARESYRRHKSGVRGQLITSGDSWDSHVAWATAKLLDARASSPNAAGAEGETAASEEFRQIALTELYEFQELTGCSTSDEYREKLTAQAAEPVAIYQIRTEEGAWLDVPQQVYERAKSDPALTRAVYATPPAPASAPVGMTAALRQAREELSQVEWENDPPARVTALFSKIDALLYGAKHE